MIGRRALLLSALAMGLSSRATSAQTRAVRASEGFFAKHRLSLGAQIYTVADAARSDLDGTFTRLAAIGYRTIELPGFLGHRPEALRAFAKRAGLALGGIQIAPFSMDDTPGFDGDMEKLVDDLHRLGVTNVVMPLVLPPAGMVRAKDEEPAAFFARATKVLTADDWKRTAAFLNDRGAMLKRAGIGLSYHNHMFEFAPVGKETGWDILMRETSPELISFELDVGWAGAAGADPVTLLRQSPARVRMMHLKDYVPVASGSFGLPLKFVSVGRGVVDWKTLLPAAFKSGVRDFYVEQEPPFEIDRFEALAQSFAYLNSFS